MRALLCSAPAHRPPPRTARRPARQVFYNDACVLLDPQLAEAHANLANALQQLGSLDLAIMYYRVGEGRGEVGGRDAETISAGNK